MTTDMALVGWQLLDRLPRFRLCHCPTPLEPLDRLSEALGGPRIWVKRDDCTGLATGGNKTRKLEYLVGDALAQGCDTLISAGALQSNHARQVAAAAARAGLRCVLVLTDSVPGRHAHYLQTGNAQMDRILGAELHVVPGCQESAPVCEALSRRLSAEGARPYVIPIGGSNGMGSLGYVRAFAEIAGQMSRSDESLDAVVLASGSGGTMAGLMLGACLQAWRGQIVGISVGAPAEAARPRVDAALSAATRLLGLPNDSTSMCAPEIDDALRGPAYGLPNAQTLEAIGSTARLEGLLLDPVYSGKGMAGLFARCREKRFDASVRNVVFLHTGGVAALSAYPELNHLSS